MITLLLLLIAYLLGSIPSGLWIGKLFFHKNLRDFGSGNTGTTNTFRILGKKAGSVVFAVDLLKGTLATLLPAMLGLHTFSPALFGLFAVLGHTFSIFDHFHGGKAVATTAGLILGYNPVFVLFLLVIFAITLYLFSMVSLSSVIAAIVAAISVLIMPAFHVIFGSYDWLFTIIILFLVGFIVIRHRENLARIHAKSENIVSFGRNLTHQKHNI
ncbi:glycerol-3-phosphate 1-O-acyltransferase PlsY [Pseudolactococcus insecticola]|uniref:Glycerol-3-phosphate acyltransferase n=1 Tax=Pseudolactococcus insecticola TaxID=2709158 RepID=A0A6A0B690_9LACT|nr:glycerol-3-phosphate 1-O-acyltransferase PlsY [Lactococcus insecticola]GFH40028.1 glycerol-3-phosphate acyltransferase [Lactococcus insecticola]